MAAAVLSVIAATDEKTRFMDMVMILPGRVVQNLLGSRNG